MGIFIRRRFEFRLGLGALLLLLQLALASSALAGDIRVWVNTNSGVYHCPGGQYYGNTKRGEYLSESEAVADGYRPAYNQPCSPEVVRKTRESMVQALAPRGESDTSQVWINTNSHVYHCPGSRYYGATKHGHYGSEAEAISTGNRPAYGARCR